MMIGMELVKDRETREPAVEERRMILNRAFERGLTLLPAGRSVIRFSPPLVIGKEDVDTGLSLLDDAMQGF